MTAKPATSPATYMLFLNRELAEHVVTLPISAEVASSIPLCMEALSSWAIDKQGFFSCSTRPNRDEDGNIYFELSIAERPLSHPYTIFAGVFRASPQEVQSC